MKNPTETSPWRARRELAESTHWHPFVALVQDLVQKTGPMKTQKTLIMSLKYSLECLRLETEKYPAVQWYLGLPKTQQYETIKLALA